MRAPLWCLAAALIACTSGNGNDDTGNNNNQGDTDTDVNNNWVGDDNGDAPSRAPDQTITGNLIDGSVMSDVGWMDDSPWYCGAALAGSYTGAHVFNDYDEGEETDLYVRLTPDGGLDMSLYLLQRTDGSTALPPDTGAYPAGGGDCMGAYDSDGNPGQPEVGCVYSTAGYSYSVLIGVAGADGLTSGSYRLEIWENDTSGGGGGCVHPDGI